jgi:hypothetical protein
MKKTIKSLQEEDRKLSQETVDLTQAYRKDPEYIAAKKKLEQIASANWKKIQPRLKEIRTRQEIIGKEVEELKRPRQPVPDAAAEMLARIKRGVESKGWRIHSATSTYAIVHMPGGRYWSGRGESSYGPSEYCVYPIDARTYTDKIKRIEGRLTKEKLAELQAGMK